jgi:hypothetical protein
MATTTPNFGWSVPTSSDLVKNGATAIETLGDSIDASLVDLKGGTTGQVLKKATNTDMDFVWAADGGKVLQVVYANTSTAVSSTSTTMADTGLTATITPTSASSKILVIFNQSYDVVTNATGLSMDLRRASTTILQMGDFYGYVSSGAEIITGHISANYLDSPATTSATTYKTRFATRVAPNTVRVNYLDMFSTMTLLEIGA